MNKTNSKVVTIVGLGYVGIPLALVVAEKGYKVIGYDIDKKKIELLSKGILPIKSDPWLEEYFRKYWRKIVFTTDPEVALKEADIIVVAVPTP